MLLSYLCRTLNTEQDVTKCKFVSDTSNEAQSVARAAAEWGRRQLPIPMATRRVTIIVLYLHHQQNTCGEPLI